MNKYSVNHERLKKIFKVIGILSIVFSVYLVFYLVGKIDILNNPKALSQLIGKHLLIGGIAFFGLQVIQVIIPIIPGGVTTVVGFLAFGPTLGLFLNFFGIIIGSCILFILVRRYGKSFILLFVEDKQLEKHEKRLSTKTFEKFFILNMISPMAPADLLIMITGLSRISFKRFLLIIVICRPISIAIYSYFWIYGGEAIKHFLMAS
ncbi:TVP38/TMEM64 family protein [Streptococcus catagoni]|uniref:TVP38/TMEM64 family protein n=1 Tax=Streptococcus catagoni TaxID=2654874 RepID=UPI0014092A6F|nr:VTT domain-containing protein [Streptococcus catagoni]